MKYSDEDDSDEDFVVCVPCPAQQAFVTTRRSAAKTGMPASMLARPGRSLPPRSPPPLRASNAAGSRPGQTYYSDVDSDEEDNVDEGEEIVRQGGGFAVVPRLSMRPPRPEPTPTPPTPPPPPSLSAKKDFSDFYDYSDMDNDDDDDNEAAIKVPQFVIPEHRGFVLDQKIRQDRDPPVGGRNQDYLGLARMYKLQRPYSDHHFKATCVLCHQRPSRDVFFPCEHRCVCPECLKSERFVEDRLMNKTAGGYCMCPLCATTIKRILPHENGKEVAKYWAWVEEIVPELPPGFLRRWGHSASALEAVYIHGNSIADQRDSVCPSS
jgi:hypothetical protein